MVLLPEEAEMTLAELRQMAARQQHQIEAQQQLLVAKEQRLKFLKQQEARHHHLAELKVDPKCLQGLRERVEAQALKIHHLKALHGQVEQQRTSNGNLGAELESIRALFSEKEKELNVAVNKVEELMRQLDEIKSNKNQKADPVSPLVTQLENMKRELIYRNKIAEDQNNHICQQRELIAQRQRDIGELDKKIADLTQRLQRKQLMNQQLANQLHNTSLIRQPVTSPHVNLYLNSNVATVEPMQRESQEPEETRDDLSAKFRGSHEGDLSEFSLKKNDPKYQTLPYNTKFTLKGKTSQDDISLLSEDAVSCSSDNSSDLNAVLPVQKPSHSIANLTPRPFGTNYSVNNHISVSKVIGQHTDTNQASTAVSSSKLPVVAESTKTGENSDFVDGNLSSVRETDDAVIKSKLPLRSYANSHSDAPVTAKVQKEKVASKTTSAKPVVPPKPTLPVKPIPPPRQTPTKERSNAEEKSDVVSMALSVLQNKSSSKDKNAFSNYRERLLYYRCVSRYGLPNLNDRDCSSGKPKISTYFPKSSDGQNQEVIRRKTATGQLPIKPKPLTIRKTPGIEPPKLKVPPTSVVTGYKKIQESTLYSASFKPVVPASTATTFPLENEEKVEPSNRTDCDDEYTSSAVVPKLYAMDNQFSDLSIIKKERDDDISEPFDSLEVQKTDCLKEERNTGNGFKLFETVDDDDSSSPCDSLECVPIHDTFDVKSEIVINENDAVHPSAAFRRVKGSLKTEGSVRSPRRVSFDPLALLLDAALEGELELVKKTACEVPNPSAANDEGITALHNAICAGHFDVVTFLVDFGCDVNAQDSDGWTPLHCAASCNNLPMVKFLVERGACIFATTLSDHETAAEKCEEEEEGFDGCSEYLYGLQDNMGIMNDGVVYAVYDYTGLNADELSFKDGDSITVLRNGDDQESEWWWSKLNDEEGYVPRNLLGLFPRISSKRD